MRKLFTVATFIAVILVMFFPVMPVSASVTATTSTNWAGYMATTTAGNPFTAVSAAWQVPAVAAPDSSFSSAWVGIGGAYRNSSKLIQAGTEQDVDSSGNPGYSVWYEVYPKAPVTVAAVAAGDNISVSISSNGGKPETWNITILDNNVTLLDRNFKLKPNFASEASAEFIVERPLLVLGHQLAPLADFGTVNFTGCTTNLGGLGGLNAVELFMTSDGTATGAPLASPGALSGNDFAVTYVGP